MSGGASTLILASKSSSRQALLRNAGVPFEAIAADIDERAVQTASGQIDPAEIAGVLASAKARHVSAGHPARFVLGADQTLSLGARLFNKADDRKQAHEHLRAFAGKTHTLHSAIAVVRDEKILFEHLSQAHVTIRALTDAEISDYLDLAGEAVLSSVGCYQVEGIGVRLVEAIDGDHPTILGLPLLPLLRFMRDHKLLSF